MLSNSIVDRCTLPSTVTLDAQNVTEINRPSLEFPHRDQAVYHTYLFKRKPAFVHFKLFLLSPACLSIFAHEVSNENEKSFK